MSSLNRAQAYASTIQWFHRAASLSIKPNNFHYSIAITACQRTCDHQHALKLLEDMKHNHIKPDTITYSAAISACEKGHQWEKALQLLQQMQRDRIKPSTITYSAAISACEKGHQWEKALQLLQQMQHDRIKPDTITYSAAIDACYKADQKDQALDLYSEALKNGCISHWALPDDGKLDFHGHTRYTAAAGLQVAFNELLSSTREEKWDWRGNVSVDELKIVTGKGLHSVVKGKCVVFEEVQRVLEQALEPRVQWKVDPSNSGQILVSKANIEMWVQANRKKSSTR